MNRVRGVFNNFMHSERYSRFTLQTEQDGERRVEVKLSEEGVDGDAEDGAGGSPTFRPALRGQSKRSLCLQLTAIVLIFIIGYMVAFLIHGKPKATPNCEAKVFVKNKRFDVPPEPQQQLTWADITGLLENKLTSQAFDKTLSDFDRPSRLAGSADDTNLGNKIFEMFKELEMKPWTDVHHVRVQTPDSTKPNQVIFGLNVFKPQGYLAYSGTGKAQGPLVYANYGRPEDFAVLSNYKIDVKNCVVILRSGKISFAQKVANAEEKGAVAVLIYSDSQDYNYVPNTEVYGHVHLGSGDPYTPGFPSFNNTQFPPTKSAGLPNIPAQTITSTMAQTILQSIGGPVPDRDTGFLGGQASLSYSLGGIENITVEVSNTLVFKEIHNVFGVIKGFIDPDRYVVLGAQRDAWANGYASANVGTSTLIELAKVIRDMVEKDGFKARRSIVFASWSAGEYGSIGATEWLEAYTASLDKSVLAYISLDGIVQGHGSFYASASPLLQNILDNAMKTVKSPTGNGTVRDMVGKTNPMRPMSIDDPAYPFLASSGIPSISFHFTSSNSDEYEYYNTFLDTKDHLDYKTAHKTSSSAAVAAQLAAQMALRLVHDHVLGFDVTAYKNLFNANVHRVNNHIYGLIQSGQLKDVSVNWLYRAKASFQRAADAIDNDIRNTDLNDPEACRLLNDRIMTIEHSLLSPYASPIETPYRHMVFGKGPHTLAAIAEMTNMTQLHTELALATWNLQACANAMVGDLWELDNEI
ncbi:transferrin receptor 1b [Periophthalmus magnuspinnatus]|uniref:transferrin receptor 1b n=1 Tax=Periophthalmus magnuspinnatus TaxID=409849 RepID=UPI00145B994F|nr:transferrin receptor 1b [Periophthalmus magnuspinnatus]